jgi:hypothetical protein
VRELVGQGKPFYSALDKAAGLLRRKVGTGSEFLKELMSIPGVKQAEIAERGLGELLNAPKMTHEQFMAALGSKPAPAIQEKVLGEQVKDNKVRNQAWDKAYEEALDALLDSGVSTDQARQRALEVADYRMNEHLPEGETQEHSTHHSQYTLPGGKNYREMLIKAPKGVDNQEKIMELEAKLRRIPMFNSTPAQQAQIATYYNQVRDLKAQEAASPKPFQGVSAHFGGEPGILASLRLKDRTAPGDMGYTLVNKKSGNKSQHYNTIEEAQAALQGMPESMRPSLDIKPSRGPEKKLLHLEELQSDWHQQGREKGYKQNALQQYQDEINKLASKYGVNTQNKSVATIESELNHFLTKDENAKLDQLEKIRGADLTAVPDAPFKKNWEEMALKRLIHHAAENGYHGVVVTPGAEQADRYSLANHIDGLSYTKNSNGTVDLAATKNNSTVLDKSMQTPEQVESMVGRDVARKIFESSDNLGSLSGLDLKVGGEGMKGFYDKKVPNILNSIGKKYGVKTELGGHKLPGNPSQRAEASERLGLAGERFSDMSPEQIQAFNQKLDDANAKQLHYFPITEEMRQDVKKNGIPLYKSGGLVLTQ